MKNIRENSSLKKMVKVIIHNFSSDELEYGRVQKMLGNGRVEAYCYDGKTRLCNIRGKMRKKVRKNW